MSKKQDIEPFKDGHKMRLFENELYHHGSRPQEIVLAWHIGKVCMLRISDVIKLKYHQVYDNNGNPRNTVITKDKKTKKFNPLNLQPLHQMLSSYHDYLIAHKISSQWLLPSSTNNQKHINRAVVYRLFRQSADEFGFKHIGCHSARKTGAFIEYMQTNNLAMVSRMLNHSSERITERYLGISDPAIKSATNSTDWESIPTNK